MHVKPSTAARFDCDLHQARYYALVPASMPVTWRQAADDWRVHDVACLGRGTFLGVPRLDVVEYERPNVSYWAVPMPSAAMLCAPLVVARLIAAGARQPAEAAEQNPVAQAALRPTDCRSAPVTGHRRSRR